MVDFKSTFERLELKYLVDEPEAERLRAQIAPYCRPDDHTVDRRGYEINTLYLDTPSRAFHRAKVDDDPYRYKLRIRTYAGDGPANLEIKEKHLDVIRKSRVAVDASTVGEAVGGRGRSLSGSLADERRVERFAALAEHHGAEPVLVVRYYREAYESLLDGYARVTFDRELVAQPVTGWKLEGDGGPWRSFDDAWHVDGLRSPVVVELKCQTRMPWWMAALVRENGLQRVGFSKYSFGIIVNALWEWGLDVPTFIRVAK